MNQTQKEESHPFNESATDDGFGASFYFDLEREKLRLEADRISFEKERLAAEMEKFASENPDAPERDPVVLTFSFRAVCVTALVCLFLGLGVGGLAGVDYGKQQSPKPRNVRVSKEFVELLKYPPCPVCAGTDADTLPRWFPSPDKHDAVNFPSPIILR